MSVPADAIARIQDIATSSTDVTIKSAGDFPVDSVPAFPCSIAYIGGGTFHMDNATTVTILPVINVEFHFSRVNIMQAHQQIDAVAIEFPRRLAADPTLNGTVQTIIADDGSPVTFEVRPFVWNDRITSEMLKFSIPVKTLQAPITTA